MTYFYRTRLSPRGLRRQTSLAAAVSCIAMLPILSTPAFGQQRSETPPAIEEAEPAERNQNADPDNPAANQQQQQGALLGVMAGPATQGREGAVVMDVMRQGPAAAANIRTGDILTSVGGQAITSPQQLTEVMRNMRPGQKVELIVLRNGQRFETEATLGDPATVAQRETRTSGYRPQQPQQFNADEPWLGVWLLDAENETDNAQGAVVGRVYPTSPAAEADLEDGDRIIAVGDQKVTSADQFVQLVGKQKAGDQLKLQVQREGRDQPQTVAVTLARRGDFLDERPELADDFPRDFDPSDDPLFGLPEHVVRMEHERRMAQQHQRLEEVVLQVLREVRDLKQEVNGRRRGDADRERTGDQSQ